MTDFSSVQGKVVVITGAGSGIGAAIAKVFSENGMKVVIADINEAAGGAVSAEISNNGFESAFVKTDVSNEHSMQEMVNFAVRTYGKLDGIVNNAGMALSSSPIHEISTQDYETVMGIDQKGVFYGIKYGAEAILKSKSKNGFIISIASTAGLQATEGNALYTSAKHAVVGLTKTAALDYAMHNIMVTCICPGTIKTEMWDRAPQEFIDGYRARIPMHCLGEPQEIANLALFLASDLARYLTGACIVIDGADMAGDMQAVQWKDPNIDR